MVFKVEIFENGLLLSCGRLKMEVFEYDDVIHHIARALLGTTVRVAVYFF